MFKENNKDTETTSLTASDIALVFSLLTLNIFYTLFWYFQVPARKV